MNYQPFHFVFFFSFFLELAFKDQFSCSIYCDVESIDLISLFGLLQSGLLFLQKESLHFNINLRGAPEEVVQLAQNIKDVSNPCGIILTLPISQKKEVNQPRFPLSVW